MRCSGRVFAAGLVLTLCATAAGMAFAVEKEPLSGGFLALQGDATPAPAMGAPPEAPAPTLAAPLESPAPAVPTAARSADDTTWGVLLRGGYFGLPNFIADEIFTKHPTVTGSSYGAEIRYHGEDGGRGGASIGLAIDAATAKADGDWQQTETSSITHASGEIRMLAFTLTGYWSLFPSWYVHPYVGIGIGVAHATGHYQDEEERGDADYWLPVVHVPIGLAVELGEHVQLAAEGRFVDGIAIGGALQVRF